MHNQIFRLKFEWHILFLHHKINTCIIFVCLVYNNTYTHVLFVLILIMLFGVARQKLLKGWVVQMTRSTSPQHHRPMMTLQNGFWWSAVSFCCVFFHVTLKDETFTINRAHVIRAALNENIMWWNTNICLDGEQCGGKLSIFLFEIYPKSIDKK